MKTFRKKKMCVVSNLPYDDSKEISSCVTHVIFRFRDSQFLCYEYIKTRLDSCAKQIIDK